MLLVKGKSEQTVVFLLMDNREQQAGVALVLSQITVACDLICLIREQQGRVELITMNVDFRESDHGRNQNGQIPDLQLFVVNSTQVFIRSIEFSLEEITFSNPQVYICGKRMPRQRFAIMQECGIEKPALGVEHAHLRVEFAVFVSPWFGPEVARPVEVRHRGGIIMHALVQGAELYE